MVPTIPILVVASVASLFALAGCGGGEAKWSGEAAQYAVYATQIPLYPGAKIEEAMGSESAGDEPDSQSEGMCWWYTVKASKEEIVAWYEQKFQSAGRTIEEDGTVVYKLTPSDGEPGEEMGVYVDGDGKFRVFENTKVGKHKDT